MVRFRSPPSCYFFYLSHLFFIPFFPCFLASVGFYFLVFYFIYIICYPFLPFFFLSDCSGVDNIHLYHRLPSNNIKTPQYTARTFQSICLFPSSYPLWYCCVFCFSHVITPKNILSCFK